MIDERIKNAEKIYDNAITDRYDYALNICLEVLCSSDNIIEIYLAHEVRCSIYISMGKVLEAIDEVSIMVDIEKMQPHPLFKRALLFIKAGRNEEAISDLTKVLCFNDNYFKETALLLRSFANLNIDKAQSCRDANLLDDGFFYFIGTKDFGYRKFSKEDLLKMACNQGRSETK